MRKMFTLVFIFFFSLLAIGQTTYVMNSGNNGTISTCSGVFVDKGGATGNYWNNQDGTITFCPQTPNTKIRLSFSSFITETSNGVYNDYLALWHGSTTSAVADVVYMGTLAPFTVTSTSADGCLTLRFVSNNTINRAGWVAAISCARPCTPPVAAFTDASTVNVCSPTSPSATVTFNASASYSPSGDGISKYVWTWGDGTTTTTTTPITTHTFTSVGVFPVKLKVRDTNYDNDPEGCLSTVAAIKTVRVLPASTFSNTPSSIAIACGNSVTLNGTASSQTITETPMATAIAPITISNANASGHISTVDYNGFFPVGQTVQAGCYPTLTFTLEHSFSADLTIDLVSPTGQTVRVFNRSNAGGSQFSGVNFGTCANNNDDGVPGCPATYTVVNTGGASWDVASSKTTASASCAGYTGPCNGLYYYIAQTYTSANSFSALNGASLNGEWKLVINDLQSYDDGVLTGWSLTFPSSCYATLQTVTPAVTSLNWSQSGSGPALPTQTTTTTSIIDPGPGICPTPGTCVGNSLTNNVNVGPFNTAGTYTYTLTATNQFGCTSTKDYTVTVTCASCGITLNTTTTSTNQTKCLGSAINSIQYTVSGNPTSVTVTGLPAGVTYTYNLGVITISGTPNVTGNFNYTINTVGCTPNATATGTITVSTPAQAGTISGNNTLCAGTSTTLTSTVAGGTWTSSNTAVATVSALGVVSALTAGITTITYTVNGTGGCSNASTTSSITVTAPAQAGSISGNNTLCAGTSATLTSTVAGGTWTSSNTAVATISALGVVSALSAGTTTITYTVNGTGGCSNASTTSSITVTAPAQAGTINGNNTLCAGTSATLTSTVAGGTWTSSNTAVATVSTLGVVSALTAGTTTITYTVNGTGGCSNASTTKTITVTAPAQAGTINGNNTLCAGTSTTLTSTVAGGTWTSSNTTVATVSALGVVSALSDGTTTITYTVNGSGGCSNASTTKTITVTAPAQAGTINGNNTLCAGTSTTLTSTVAGGTWTSSNTAVATVSALGVVSVLSAGTTTITYTVNGTGGCSNASTTKTITVTAPAQAGTISGNNTLCAGTSTTLTSTVAGGTWTSSNIAVATVSALGVVSALSAGTTTITYTVNGAGGCSNASTTKTITVTANNIVDANDDNAIAYVPTGTMVYSSGLSILSNDTVNGNPALLSGVTITFINSTHPNITLNTTTGEIIVGSNVPEDEYELTYQICASGCGNSCNTATVTIRVMNLFTIPEKSSYVFACYSDYTMTSYDSLFDEGFTIGGMPATASNATISIVSGNGISVNTDGTISIAPGTITYDQCPLNIPFSYMVCSNSICTSIITGYIKISPTLYAEHDKIYISPLGDACEPDKNTVLFNDIYNTCEKGYSFPHNLPANSSNIALTQLTPSSYFTIAPDSGEIIGSSFPIPIGLYTLTYQICDLENAGLCSINTVDIVVDDCHMSKSRSNIASSVIDMVSVAPNPSEGIFGIKFNKVIEGETHLEVSNSLGQMVYNGQFDNTNLYELNLTHLPSGTYSLKISNNDKSVIKRIIKK
jgi:subtilisin-like proprotein convertase family protein